VDWSHVLPEKLKRLEACDIQPIEAPSNGLMDIGKNCTFSSELLGLWAGFFSSSAMFSTKEQVITNLQTVVSYCETDPLCTETCKNQLRYVHQELKKCPGSGIDAASIIVILAAHGYLLSIAHKNLVTLAMFKKK
jgi:hypothetical protein